MPGAPLYYRWEGDGFVPLGRHARMADEQFVIGQVYRLEVVEERSAKTHRHQFAWLREAWLNLPEQYRFEPWAQSPEHLRKYALIRAGWHDCQTFACGSAAEAQRWAARLKPLDDYSLVIARGSTVERYTAKSQSVRAMGKKDFQASKTAVLEFVAGLLEVDPSELEKADAA